VTAGKIDHDDDPRKISRDMIIATVHAWRGNSSNAGGCGYARRSFYLSVSGLERVKGIEPSS
jgi:hypothetical protein